jgi:hypothetical protein
MHSGLLLNRAAMVAALCCLLAGPIDAADKLGKNGVRKAFDYPMIGDDTTVEGLMPQKVEGIGLVVGLRGTGSDPPPNHLRENMLDIMKKKQVANAEKLLASNETCIVILRAFLPPGVQKGDMVDVEVWIPPGDGATSLKGGYLLESTLFDSVIVRDQFNLKGKETIQVKGPVLIAESGGTKKDDVSLQKGKILGQGKVMITRDFHLVLPKDKRSLRRAQEMTQRLNQRFFDAKEGQSKGLAKFVDQHIIELKLAKQYRYDVQRYLLVSRKIPVSNAQQFRLALLKNLAVELEDPRATIETALRLEALGSEAIPILKQGLQSETEVVRFASAQALAYLGDSSGANELARLAEHSNLYRTYALGALVALDHPISRMHLSRLLHAPGAETRYGAFRAMWVFDKMDPMVRGEPVGEQFFLHQINSKAEPMVHVSRMFRREIVLFGDQEIKTPFALRAGEFILLNADANAAAVHLACVQPLTPGGRMHAESSLKVADVLREAVRLGATYGDVVQMLQQAADNGLLPGRLAFNALPPALPLEAVEAIGGSGERGTPRVTTPSAPTLFTSPEEARNIGNAFAPKAASPKAAKDKSTDDDEENLQAEKPKRSRWNLFRRSAN